MSEEQLPNNYGQNVHDFREAFLLALESKAQSTKYPVATPLFDDWFPKGIRDTDLIFLTAKANSGKTTLLCQMAYDFASVGTPVCVMSGETPVPELVEERFWGLAGLPPENGFKDDADVIKAIIQKVPEIPLYLPTWEGKWEMRKDCVPFMDWMRKEYGIKMFFMDHLRFFLNESSYYGESITQERLKYQDTSENLRLYAKDNQTLVFMAVQPAKTPQDAEFQGSSMYGSVAMEQDATIILQLERPRKKKDKGQKIADNNFEEYTIMTLFKNRNGKNGLIKRIIFDETTKRFVEYKDHNDILAGQIQEL